MTVPVHLNQCCECGGPTGNRSLICDGCAPEYTDDLTEAKLAKTLCAMRESPKRISLRPAFAILVEEPLK